jgi:uncharacterized SAM-binding protein YcdF (DUF218 family)
VTIGFILLAAWELLAWGAARFLIVKADLQRADALVVMSGASNYVERTRWAARLFKEGRAPRVILTNDNTRGKWSRSEERNPFFVERAAEELRLAGVPVEKIEVLPQAVDSTYSESVLLRDYATKTGLRSMLVVTSPYHSRRALWTLRRVFDDTDIQIGLDAPPPGEQSAHAALWWLTPDGWREVAGEYLKFIYHGIWSAVASEARHRFGFRISECGMRNAECGFGIADLGLRI